MKGKQTAMKLQTKNNVISILVLLFAITSTIANAAGTANITSHTNNSKVTTPEYLEGACSDIAEGIYLWVVVRPKNTQYYHPQSMQTNHGPITNGCQGQWEGIAHIGESPDKNINEHFEIFLVGATLEGSVQMQNYLVKANQRHRWPGISKLPSKTTIYQKMEVIRR